MHELDRIRDLYCNLLIKILVNSIYCDPDSAPWSSKRFTSHVRAEGRDWPSIAHTMVGEARLRNLHELCVEVIRSGVPGDFVEAGVWRGGACILMRAILSVYEAPQRRVFCCDSFAGLPRPNPIDYPADKDDRHHQFSELAISLDEVKSNFSKYDLLDDTTVFVPGWFRDTLHTIDTKGIAILRLDGDMYESTIQTLDSLYHKVSPGGFIVVDDYGAVPACRQAVHDFLGTNKIDCKITPIDWTGVWWRKEALA